MDRLVQYLVYKKNPLRQLGLVGLKSLHLEANPNQHKMILEKIHARFGPDFNLNNTQRTLAQFLCQESLYSNLFQKMASKILFAGVVPILFLVIIAKSFKSYPRTKSKVFVYRYGDLGYLNSDFQDSEIQAIPTDRSTGNNLSWFDIKFFFKLLIESKFQYLFHPKLLVNILRWVTSYSWVVKFYQPEVVATFLEGTAASSVLTEYLNSQNIQHHNYAHGEHFRYDCYSAYANFNRYVIWGEHFKNIQIEKNCRPEMFFTRAPAAFVKFFYETRHLKKIKSDQVTVLINSGVERGSTEYVNLVMLFNYLADGTTVVLRPHPVDRASWPQVADDLRTELDSVGKNLNWVTELPENTPMKFSIIQSSIFIGPASAALLEALLAGCKIIYIPNRVKNNDVIERHQKSRNVLFYSAETSSIQITEFLSAPFIINEAEDNKIKYLFKLD